MKPISNNIKPLIIFSVSFTLSFVCSAEFSNTNQQIIQSNALPNPWVSLLRVLGATILVVGLLFLFAWIIKRWNKFSFITGKVQKLRLIESCCVGKNCFVSVVTYQNHKMILGITPSSISLLLQLPDQNGQLKENEEPNFKNTLNKAFQNTDNK